METLPQPIRRPRADHCISRKNIDRDALSVLYHLSNSGYTAYLVGGGVRDILLGRPPKDFDVATNAHPGQIRKLFRNAFLIGRRFRLALIKFGPNKQIEVSTFRRQPEQEDVEDDSRPGALYQFEDNYFGTPAEDAFRRDFTINGLFYDIRTFDVIDYVGGLKDLDRKILRCIGDPNIRFREDPVRMMRAVRFAMRLGFSIHKDSERAIEKHHSEIQQASKPRLYEEILKLYGHGTTCATFRLLWTTKLMADIFQGLYDYVQHSGKKRSPLWDYLREYDAECDNPAAPEYGLRVAVLLCPLYMDHVALATKKGKFTAEGVAKEVVESFFVDPLVAKAWRIPRLIVQDAEDMLSAQVHFDQRDPHMKRSRVFSRVWFEGALLLYKIRMKATGKDTDDTEAWERSYAHYKERNPDTETAE